MSPSKWVSGEAVGLPDGPFHGEVPALLEDHRLAKVGVAIGACVGTVCPGRSAWYRTNVEGNPIRQVIDRYVDTYDLYSLSILVDLDGRVIAVNSKDADGKPIQSQSLSGKIS